MLECPLSEHLCAHVPIVHELNKVQTTTPLHCFNVGTLIPMTLVETIQL